MTQIISVTGKGGVGKTTFSALIIKYLTQERSKVVLAVDADSNSTLGDMLGIKVERTIGDLREELLREKDNLPESMAKADYVNYQIQSAIVEDRKFDLIAMGRPEGPGCYCYINSILRNFLDNISAKYEFVVIDNEAGMEHLSRRTTMKMDHMFIVSEPTQIGIMTAARIRDLAREMDIKIGRYELIVNRLKNGISQDIKQFISESDFPGYTALPFAPEVEELMAKKSSMLELSRDSELFGKIIELGSGI